MSTDESLAEPELDDPDPDELEPDPILQLIRRAASAFRRRFTSRQRVIIAALVLIFVQLLFRAWASYGSWFMWDDYQFLADIALGNDGWRWLFQSHYGLFMPVSLLLVKMVGGIGVFNWSLIATQMVLLQAVTSLACWWMLRKLFGDKKLILVPLAFYLFVPMTIPMSAWWSVAINQYPHHIAIFGAVTAHVAYERSKNLRYTLLSTAFLILGLGSYIKAPLIVIVLVAISWAFFTEGTVRRRIVQLLTSWIAWTMYVVATLVYAVIWLSKQAGSAPRQLCELPGTLGTSLLDGIGSAVIGGPWHWELWTGGVDPFVAASKCVPPAYKTDPGFLVGGAPQSLLSPPLLGLVLAWLFIFAAVVYVWAQYSNALRCLWFIVPYVLLTVVLIFVGRTNVFGSQVSAREIRYFSDVAAILAIGIGTMLLPIQGALVHRAPRSEPYVLVSIPRWIPRVAAVIFLVGSLVSSVAYVSPWHTSTSARQFPERVFTQHIISQIQHRANPDAPVLVADVPLPEQVASQVIAPYNLPSRKFAPLHDQLKAQSAGTDLKIIDGDGNIRPSVISKEPRTEPGPVKNCGYLVQKTGTTIPIVPVINFGWWISMDYLASADGTAKVHVGETTRKVPVKSGLHTLFVHTSGAFSELQMTADKDLSVCVDNVRVGFLNPKAKHTPK